MLTWGVLLIEAGKFTEADEHVVSLLKGRAGKTICGLTKIDLVKRKNRFASSD